MKFGKIHRKTPVLESLFNKVAEVCNFLKKRLKRRCFTVTIAKVLRTTFFSRASLVAAFVDYQQHWLTHFKPLVCLIACVFLMFVEGVVVWGRKWVETNSVCKLYSLPSRRLVQSQQQKYQNNMWNLFKVNNKDSRTTSLTSFYCLYCWTDFIHCSGVSGVDFKQVNTGWVSISYQ